MIIVTQEHIDVMNSKYGEEFKSFMNSNFRSLESMFMAWKFRKWLSDCFQEIDSQDDIVNKITMNVRTFSKFRAMGGEEGFNPVTQREVLETGHWGDLWTAQMFVDKSTPTNVLLFESEKGVKKEFKMDWE